MAVESTLRGVGLAPEKVDLGLAQLATPPTESQLSDLRERLRNIGFELIEEGKEQTVERIKNVIIRQIHYANAAQQQRMKLSAILSEELGIDYSALSKLFSEAEGRTIESYTIAQRIERVKELLEDPALTLKEIAFKTGYSSTAHLSAQFKDHTGMPPSAYRKGRSARRNLDQV